MYLNFRNHSSHNEAIYTNMKVKVRSLDEDTDFFDIVAVELKGDTLAP